MGYKHRISIFSYWLKSLRCRLVGHKCLTMISAVLSQCHTRRHFARKDGRNDGSNAAVMTAAEYRRWFSLSIICN